VELTRFRLPGFKVEDKEVAELFGLELGRLAIDGGYRDFVIECYESEKRRIQRRQRAAFVLVFGQLMILILNGLCNLHLH
jgi:hypothetical protein